jgi:hypothetical protein
VGRDGFMGGVVPVSAESTAIGDLGATSLIEPAMVRVGSITAFGPECDRTAGNRIAGESTRRFGRGRPEEAAMR